MYLRAIKECGARTAFEGTLAGMQGIKGCGMSRAVEGC